MKFQEYSMGLYYYDTARKDNSNFKKDKQGQKNYLFLTTVAKNKKQFTKHEVDRANKAGELYKHLGQPSQQEFERVLD